MKKGSLLFLTGLVILFSLPLAVRAQETRSITGTVTSAEDGQPLPGANVVAAGTTTGTATDREGQYELAVPATADTLVFSFIGYLAEEVAIDGRSVIDVALTPALEALEEIVVVGYGTQLQREVTGSIAQVSAEDIQNVPVTSMEQALQGRVAGVVINSGSGKLGQGIYVRVRGSASVSADNQPLYVVDGIPVTTADLSGNDATTNPLAHLNLNDIASIEVLKDASAAAIYGARGSNGVVIITTKEGLAGVTQFTANLRRSWSAPTNTVDLLNAEEYVRFFTEAARNRGEREWQNNPADYASEQDAINAWVNEVEEIFDFYARGTNWRELDVNADWQEEAFREDAGGLRFDLSARGGSEKTQFFLSGSFDAQDGILIRDNYDRMTGRINLDHQFSDRFSLGGNLSLARVFHTRLPYDNAFSTPVQLIAQLPISPIYAPDETVATVMYTADGQEQMECDPYGDYENGDCYFTQYRPTEDLNMQSYYFNNLLYIGNVRYETRIFRSLGSAYAELEVLPGLVFRSQFGLDVLDQNEDQYYNSKVFQNTGANKGVGLNAWDRVVNYNIDNYLTYNGSFGEAHDVEVTAGTSYQSVTRDGAFVEAEEFPNDDFTQIESAATITDGGSYETGYRFLSYFARANYSFEDKYLLSLSGRYDGSSRFGRDNRYGFFPSASVGWILTEEPFLGSSDALNLLKLRASYGLTGNAGIGNFPALGLWQASTYGGASGIFPEQTPNPALKWERTAQLDLGVDFGFFNGRISGTFDFYRKSTNDLLLDVNVPATTGFLIQTRNVGKLKNWGYEFLVNTENIVGAFSWSSGLNFSINRNKITDVNGQVIEDGFANRAIEGEPIGVFYGYEYAGVDPQKGDALFYVNEKDEDGNIIDTEATTNDPNEANQVVIGNPHPDFTGGFRNHFFYKGFELSVFLQFVYGNEIYDGGGLFKTSNGRFLDNQLATQLDAWQEPGDVTDVPEARFRLNNGTANSDRYLYDGSYLRLKNVTLAYNLPQSLLQSLQLSSARVYVTGINLLTFTDYPWFDPEAYSDYADTNVGLGGVFYTAPQARTLSAGIQFSF